MIGYHERERKFLDLSGIRWTEFMEMAGHSFLLSDAKLTGLAPHFCDS